MNTALNYDHMAEALITANRRLHDMLKVLAARLDDNDYAPQYKESDLELFMQVRNIQRDLNQLNPALGDAIPHLMAVVKQPLRPMLHAVS